MRFYRPTKAIVDLEAIRENVRRVKERVNPAKIMAVVKANGLGHGMVKCAQAAFEAGATYFGVATLDEALNLRRYFLPSIPILILGPIFPSDVRIAAKHNIEVAIGSIEQARALHKYCKRSNHIKGIHLKIDTGMGRYGFWFEEIEKVLEDLSKLSYVKIIGVMTHFTESDSTDPTYTNWQIENFKKVLKTFERMGVDPGIKHTSASAAIHQHPKAYFDMVRLGVSLYGYYPSMECLRDLKLVPALSLITKVVKIREMPPDRFISYGRTFKTARHSRIGILPIGYGDGFLRTHSNNGEVLVRGRRAPIIGRICMDQTMIDLTDIPSATEGDEVVLIGSQNGNSISMEEVAARTKTVPYEITCTLGNRIPRIYINK